ncbi:MAG: P1 family peptidase [Gemmatimonadetes bacterium]|nr:P1 family peptidase [Gemmatimonadota bacterium]MBK7833610.1 P1 family peptidase [Gemmatimonadota bacterium]MBK8646197.1 P1 family peptidase [Gemmatimonadota bacterium]
MSSPATKGRCARALRRATLTGLVVPVTLLAQAKPRERDLGLPIGGTPGTLDAITDVKGVEVGHTTLITGSGKLVVGKGPVRTGVTVVHPRGKDNHDPVFASWFTLNGNGEMTGTTWVQESGYLEGPVAITNTHSVGVVRDAIIKWEVTRKNMLQPWWLPVVAETYDGGLNDINGFHVKEEHVLAALDNASGGLPKEGVVGGGTGMSCHGFKGGIGTASRVLPESQGGYTVGVLVQCNYGVRRDLRIAGVPVGEEIPDLASCYAVGPEVALDELMARRRCGQPTPRNDDAPEQGSIIVVVATDAPLLPHQLKRIATRVSLGIGRQGGFGGNGSGDIFIAFSTANPKTWSSETTTTLAMLTNDRISPLFQATAQATEAAITNALLAAETTTGANDLRVFAMPVDRMMAAMRKYGRIK